LQQIVKGMLHGLQILFLFNKPYKMLTFACICGAVDERLSVSGAAVTRV